jgi:dTDP-glucose 4,6-dehydratase
LKILVTGGAGFIGSNFVNLTLATRTDVDVTVLDALTYAGDLNNLESSKGRFKFVEGDICDTELVDSLVKVSDVVINFAAETHNDLSLVAPDRFIQTNVLGTMSLIKACQKHGVRYHHISTDEVFGDLPLDTADQFTNETPYNPSSPYSASKASSDLLVRAWVRSFGLKATISNCSNNFGPYQNAEKFIPRTVRLANAGLKPKIYGEGLNVRDWIHVDDHNRGLWAILEKGQIGQTYLLGTNNQRTNLSVVKLILQFFGLPADHFEYVEDRAGHDQRYAIDSTVTQSELDWHPQLGKFEEQLVEVIPYYQNDDVDISTISHSGHTNLNI